MTHAPKWTTIRAVVFSISLLATAMAANCSDQKESRPVNTRPVEQPATAADAAEQTPPATQPAQRPTATKPAATQPTAREQTKPAETRPETAKPESTYDSKPPYPVALYVKSPSEKQPGWLRIEGLIEGKEIATARGKFPEQNRIYVETGNVRRIRIHVGHLPLRPNERVVLQIDKQGMVISRTRPYTTLELSPTGEWVVLKEKE